MARVSDTPLTGRRRLFGDDELIVTKTDPTGRITYANDVFVNISGFAENELLGQPHSMIRHPEMPRAVFKLLWDRIQAGREIFAFVCNRAKNGDHYWVLAHVTPNFDAAGGIVGYHSSRRTMADRALDAIEPLYRALNEVEHGGDRKEALVRSSARLEAEVARLGYPSYDRLILDLGR